MGWARIIATGFIGIQIAVAPLASAAESPVGAKAENFTLKDFRGKEHALTDFGDSKLIVLAFLGTECPLAKLYGPRLAALADEFGTDVAFLGINANVQDSVTEIAAYARMHGINFPILKDVGNKVADTVGAVRTPEVFVLDEQRIVRYRGRIDDQYGVGYVRDEPQQHDLKTALEELLAGSDLSTPSTETVGCHIGRVKQPKADAPVTYSNQISRILQNRCVECHREGDIAPFEMTDYDEVVGWAEMIEEVVRERRMPPWHADPAYGHFVNDRSLSDEEREQIYRWVADGAPQGDPKDLPKPREFTTGWQLPREPDLVLHICDEAFRVKAEGEVKYQWFTVDPGFDEDKWLQAAEIVPGNRAVVHHILAFSRQPGAKERVSERDGFLVAYVPGLRAKPFPQGMAKLIPAGSELVFQVHYTPIGSEQLDRSKIGLIFSDPDEVTHVVQTAHAINLGFEIPPHVENHEVKAATPESPRDVLLLSLMPHTHLRGKSFSYEARYPDGETETLLNVPQYDFNWQTAYTLIEPKRLPQGTRIHCVAHYDNSENNLSNPDPTVTVRWGDQTWEEMMLGYFDIAWPVSEEPSEANLFGRDGADPRSAAESLISMFDKNEDGELARAEVPRKHLITFFLVDTDRDGVVTLDEMTESIKKQKQRESRRRRLQ